MKVLFLDDEDWRHKAIDEALTGHEIHHVRTVERLHHKLRRFSDWDLVSLDHDLGQTEDGRDAVRSFLKFRPQPSCLCLVHSWNQPAAAAMVDILRGAGATNYIQYPFSSTLLENVLPAFGFVKINDERVR